MAAARSLMRNVKPKQVVQDDFEEDDEVGSVVEDGDSQEGEAFLESGEDEDEEEDEEDEEDDVEVEDVNAEQQIAHVSFGALKQAQDALSRKRKREPETAPNHEDKLEEVRKRLKEIREAKAGGIPMEENKPRSAAATTQEDDDSASDSDSAPSEEGIPSRTSKHAPATQTTRHQVTRKRTVIPLPKPTTRDPRFDPLHQSSQPTTNTDKAYSFLTDYQKSEILELKAALKRSKSEDDKITLRRKINSMENRLKAKEAKEREQEVVRKHRKEEKKRVDEGKTPYFLKRKEIKERALVEKYQGMKGKEREKAVERRRRKEGQKEKKRMPGKRRV